MGRKPTAGPVVIPNCVEVKMIWNDGAKDYSNVLHGTYTGTRPLPSTLAETLFAAFKTGFSSSGLNALVHNSTSFTKVWVKDLNSANNAWVLSSGAAQAGTGANPALASNVALVVTLQTAKSGRAYRGRTYIGGLAGIAQLDAKHATGAAGTAAKAFLDAIKAAMQTNNMPMAIANRALNAGTDSQGNQIPARAADLTPVTQTAIVNARLDSQRRRLGR